MTSNIVRVFDFDGTITSKDSLLGLISYAFGRPKMILCLLLYSPLLFMMKIGKYPSGMAKQHIFSHFFKGISEHHFISLCKQYAESDKNILRSDIISIVNKALQDGEKVVIVSASADYWIVPFLSLEPFSHDASEKITIISTQLEVKDGKLTGQFASKNCSREEKVLRLCSMFPNLESYKVIAYGDSKGDKEMLEYSDEPHWV